MAKTEWGTKRTCQSCGAKFYDLMRTPVKCPKCDAVVEVDLPFKPRRAAAVAAKTAAVVAKKIPLNADVALDADETAGDGIDGGDDDESGLIEDASDLGEDDDDMAEVMEHLDENLEDEV